MTARGNRRNVPVRLAEPGIALIEQRAKAEGVNRADMIRLLLAYATEKMPAGWRPGR